ncbi:hypothetical protein GOBAR_DD09103 [Gossypium barbadense]|nr:hypothetical protein GOBAR_DD09103 [Gossypium barbadense]
MQSYVVSDDNISIISDRGKKIIVAIKHFGVPWRPIYCIQYVAVNFHREYKNTNWQRQVVKIAYELESHLFLQMMTRLENDMEGETNTLFQQWMGTMELWGKYIKWTLLLFASNMSTPPMMCIMYARTVYIISRSVAVLGKCLKFAFSHENLKPVNFPSLGESVIGFVGVGAEIQPRGEFQLRGWSDANGNFPPIQSSAGDLAFRARNSGGVIVGISIAAIVVLLLLGIGVYIGFFRKKVKGETLSSTDSQDLLAQVGNGNPAASLSPFPFKSFGSKAAESTPAVAASPGLTGISVDKSVEFSYEELALATDNFSMAKKIGEGGFGAVYYANLRGEEAAIKKMDMQATKEFLAELKVLTHVHHLNLVRLIGYCVEGSLFLVYEYIENGNLSQHLRGSGREPLPWSTRVQIALDSARGLEYIHEHTVPVYIHRDIKSANILIDKKFRAKVADFGLTKLTEVGNSSLPTRLVGTFGYMPPEYAQYGDVSPKIDVFAFGVVLYELISAKEAIVKANSSLAESKGLVALFEDGLDEPDPKAGLCKLIDPTLGDNYPLDSVFKMAQLAKACTQENPQLRPSMRSIVVALMTLSSTTEDWDVGTFYENQAVVNLMSGR